MKISKDNRMEFLDTLRCIAVLSVICQHIGERFFPSFAYFTTHYFQFGVFGVTLFFLCSGFIIPVSLQKKTSLSSFWIKRFFRLYPLYLVSLVLGLIGIKLGLYHHDFPNATELALQLTMLQKLIGAPLIIPSHWTLSLEMFFYISITALYLVKMLNKTLLLSIGSLTAALFIGVFLHSGYGLIFYIATMFTGTVFYKYIKRDISLKAIFSVLVFAIGTIVLITFYNLYGTNDLSEYGARNFVPVLSAWIFAYIVFTLLTYLRRIEQPKFALFLGKISYSLYLMQGIVLAVVPFVNNVYITSLIITVSILVISTVTYYTIEKPFSITGSKVAKRVIREDSISQEQQNYLTK